MAEKIEIENDKENKNVQKVQKIQKIVLPTNIFHFVKADSTDQLKLKFVSLLSKFGRLFLMMQKYDPIFYVCALLTFLYMLCDIRKSGKGEWFLNSEVRGSN